MAKRRTTKTATKSKGGGRGSPEAVAKRRAARSLNTMFGSAGAGPTRDGRTEKRRQRLLTELQEGERNGRPLKALEVLVNTNELLELGETLSSIRKRGAKPLKAELSDEDMEIVHRTQQEYGFRPEAWKMLGVDLGGPTGTPARRSRKKAA